MAASRLALARRLWSWAGMTNGRRFGLATVIAFPRSLPARAVQNACIYRLFVIYSAIPSLIRWLTSSLLIFAMGPSHGSRWSFFSVGCLPPFVTKRLFVLILSHFHSA